MTKDKKRPWYRSREVKSLQKKWYKILEDEGFYDIEGGVEGHLLKGPTSTVSLKALANKRGAVGELKQDHVTREFADVADSEGDLVNYSEGGKARYYHHAALLAVQAIREGTIPDERCYAWAMHSQGDGERIIAEHLGVSRSQIRKHIMVLRDNITERLDNEYR